MIRRIENIKYIVVDIDSFANVDYDEFNKLNQIVKCIFISSNKQTINKIEENINDSLVMYFPLFIMWTIPNVSFVNRLLDEYKVKIVEICFLTSAYDFARRSLFFISPVILIANKITYEQASALPDLVRSCMADLLDSFKTNKISYCGELSFDSLTPSGVVLRTRIEDMDTKFTIFALGRYYNSEHYLHNLHDYSVAILKNKTKSSRVYGIYDNSFSNIYVSSAEIINNKYHIDCACSVPCRPSEENRFYSIVNNICDTLNIDNISDSFLCVYDYPKQKSLSAQEKEINVKGVFQYTDNNIQGKNILLIDDIISSGATIKECVKILLEKGASNVYCLVLAINQYPQIDYWTYLYPNYKCPKCQNSLKLQINSKDKSKFYSCPLQNKGNCDFRPVDYNVVQNSIINEETKKILEHSLEIFEDIHYQEINTKCPFCGSDNSFSEEECDVLYNERPMGKEKLIEMDDFEITCFKCNKNYYINGYISEYPIGSIECKDIVESKEPKH